VGDRTYKLHLTPSGVISGARLLIGPGVVLNPMVLWTEIEALRAEGLRPNIGIDAKTSRYTELAITKLDVLGGLDPIKICTGYELAARH